MGSQGFIEPPPGLFGEAPARRGETGEPAGRAEPMPLPRPHERAPMDTPAPPRFTIRAETPGVEMPSMPRLTPPAHVPAAPDEARPRGAEDDAAPNRSTQHQAEPLQHQAELLQHQAQPVQHQAQPSHHQVQPVQHQVQPVQHQAQASQHQAQPVQHQAHRSRQSTFAHPELWASGPARDLPEAALPVFPRLTPSSSGAQHAHPVEDHARHTPRTSTPSLSSAPLSPAQLEAPARSASPRSAPPHSAPPPSASPSSSSRAARIEPAAPDARGDDRSLPEWSLVLADGVAVPLYGPVVVGRKPSGERFPGATLAAVPDTTRTMSKTHARFYLDEGVPMVDDLGSTNGIALFPGGNTQGAMAVEPGSPAEVRSGDVVQLGEYEIGIHRN